MENQTIKPALPITKIKNNLQNKKVKKKSADTSDEKSVVDSTDKKKGGIDTYV